jgi:hypothetical protein
MYITYQFQLSVEDEIYDACKTANIKFQADISCQVQGVNELWRHYSRAFIRRTNSFVRVSISYMYK